MKLVKSFLLYLIQFECLGPELQSFGVHLGREQLSLDKSAS